MAFKKLEDEPFRTEADLCVEMVATEESLDAKRTCVKRFERELATKVERRKQLLAEHREMIPIASCPIAKGVDSFRDLRLKIAAMTSERF